MPIENGPIVGVFDSLCKYVYAHGKKQQDYNIPHPLENILLLVINLCYKNVNLPSSFPWSICTLPWVPIPKG